MTAVKTLFVSLSALVVLATLAPAAAAQPGNQPGPPAAAKRERVRQRIAAMRAWKLSEALALDEATAGKLFPVLNQYDDRFAAVLREGGELRRELRAELGGGRPSDEKVNRIIDGLIANQRAMWKLQEDRFSAVRRVLSPVQAAKAAILLPEIDRAIAKQIRKAMKRGPGPGAGPPGGELRDPFGGPRGPGPRRGRGGRTDILHPDL